MFSSRGHATPPRYHSFLGEAVPFPSSSAHIGALLFLCISAPRYAAANQITSPLRQSIAHNVNAPPFFSAALLMRAIRRRATPPHIGSTHRSALPQLPVLPCICASPMHCFQGTSVAIRSYAAALRIGSVLSAAAPFQGHANQICSISLRVPAPRVWSMQYPCVSSVGHAKASPIRASQFRHSSVSSRIS